MTFDFTSVFSKIGTLFTNGLRNRMLRQESLDGGGYSRPELSTLKGRGRALKGKNLRGTARKPGNIQAVPITRMVVTRDTALSAFKSEARRDGLVVFVSEGKHRQSGERYVDLIKYNSRDSGETNPNIKSPPLIFPTNAEQVQMMRTEMDTAWNLFALEARRQIDNQARLRLKIELGI